MPVVNFYLIENMQSGAAVKHLLKDSTELYLNILYPDITPRPIERVRAFATMTNSDHWATAGEIVSEGGDYAPFFTFIVLEGRSPDQWEKLMKGFTDLLVEHLTCARKQVRGQVIEVSPSHWGIGGVMAAELRRAEIKQRTG